MLNNQPQWVKDFENDTAKWHKSLLETEQCLVCGIRPDLILQVSKLIPVELDKAREEGRQEGIESIGKGRYASQIKDGIRQEERARIISLIDGMKSYSERHNELLEIIKNKINE